MAELIKLNNPIKINGSDVTELKYDIEKITAENLCEADARASTGLAAKGIQNMNIAEFNTALHFYLGCFAIIACDSSIDIEDLKRIEGRDSNKIRKIGQSFFADSAEEADTEDTTNSTQKQSEDSSEATAESTTKGQKVSKN